MKKSFFGLHHIGLSHASSWEALQSYSRQLLYRSLNTRSVIGFIGSGVSAGYGYPTWSQMTNYIITKTLEMTRDGMSPVAAVQRQVLLNKLNESRKTCQTNKKRKKESKDPSDKRRPSAPMILELCDTLLNSSMARPARTSPATNNDIMTKLVTDYFSTTARTYPQAARDPIALLISQLNIKRFVTTNYDSLIGDALEAASDHVAQATGVWSLNRKYPENLIRFSVGAPGFEAGVFHLHGRIINKRHGDGEAPQHANPVLTYTNYQDLYIRDDDDYSPIQDALDLLFSTNAFLFSGFGFSEEDPLRPLRRFVSDRMRENIEWPFFALATDISETPSQRSERFFDLNHTYGVKLIYPLEGRKAQRRVLPHFIPSHAETLVTANDDKTTILCKSIKHISRDRSYWWNDWQLVPTDRRPQLSKIYAASPRSNDVALMLHHPRQDQLPKRHQIKRSQPTSLRHTNASEIDSPTDDAELHKALLTSKPLIVVIGPPGSGKGSLATRLAFFTSHNARTLKKEVKYPTFNKTFYANIHLMGEFPSIVDAVTEYFCDVNPSSISRETGLKLLRQRICSDRVALIIGGIDLLLVPLKGDAHTYSRQREVANSGLETCQQPSFGRPITEEVNAFFRTLASVPSDAKGRVILMGAMWPTTLKYPVNDDHSTIVHIPPNGILPGAYSRSISHVDLRSSADIHDISALSESLAMLLAGNVYALSLVRIAIAKLATATATSGHQPHHWLRRLVADVSAMDTSRRSLGVIPPILSLCAHYIENLDRTITPKQNRGQNNPKAKKSYKQYDNDHPSTYLLRALAIFGTPVERWLLRAICKTIKTPMFNKIVTELLEWKLVIEIGSTRSHSKRDKRYVVHSLVRSHFVHAMRGPGAAPGEPPSLSFSDFAADLAGAGAMVEQQHANIASMLDSLLSMHLLSSERDSKWAPDENLSPATLKRRARHISAERKLVRTAFRLVRSNWNIHHIARMEKSANQIILGVRHSSLEAYQSRLVKLLRRLHVGHNILEMKRQQYKSKSTQPNWYFTHASQSANVRGYQADAFLYADELSWIYNELGVSAYAQGSLQDAHARFEVAKTLGRIADRSNIGDRTLQSNINLGMTQLERARLQRAREYFREVIRVVGSLELKKTDSHPGIDREYDDIRMRATGYTALIDHLQGDYRLAEMRYKLAIDAAEKEGNLRSVSIFCRHYGDFLRHLDRFNEAMPVFARSIAAAEAGRHVDLLHYSSLAKVNCLRKAETIAETGYVEAQRIVQRAKHYAANIGIPKLMAESITLSAALALDRGDAEVAAHRASKMLGVCTIWGMRLRVTTTLIFLGEVEQERKYFKRAGRLLRSGLKWLRGKGTHWR